MSITKIQSPDEMLNRIQDGIIREVNPVLANVLLRGRLLEDVAVATSSTAVSHGLGRPPKGWIVVDQNVAAHVHSPSASTDKFLYLIAGSAATLSLWVF